MEFVIYPHKSVLSRGEVIVQQDLHHPSSIIHQRLVLRAFLYHESWTDARAV
jgi:hypothetical protein